MPIYEYQCGACGHEFEREQRITEHPVKSCPKCSARRAQRLISRTSFVLKGGGWHSDLYSSAKPEKKEADKKTGDAKSGSEKSDKPTESATKPGKKAKGPKNAA